MKKMPSYWTERDGHVEFDMSFLDSEYISDEEIYSFSDEERERYIRDRRCYHEWHRAKERSLYKQGVMGAALVLMNIMIPNGAAILLVPLGVGLLVSAVRGNLWIG